MSPTVADGDYVISVFWRSMRYKEQDIVLLQHPEYKLIIKRIIKLKPDGSVLLVGDNVKSTSSETLGWQHKASIIAKVIFHIPSERRPIPPFNSTLSK